MMSHADRAWADGALEGLSAPEPAAARGTAQPSLSVGSTLGPYRILARVGAGGMGEVYRARDVRLERDVALKVLPRDIAASPERRARFSREARLIAQLQHPHVCALYDVGTHDGVGYLVMEYLEGETLAARLQRGPLSVPAVCTIGAQIADALAAAHGHGIVHRDLKPANVMLWNAGAGGGGEPPVKLLDFGLAVLRDDPAGGSPAAQAPTATESATRAGEILGTRPYMAPEQVEGKATDARTDLWALGCILYEMLTGRQAFEGESAASVTAAILDRQPDSLARLRPDVPRRLARLVESCLAKRPGDRWHSAHDAAEELRWIADRPEGFAPRWIGSAARRVVVVAAVIVAVVAGAFGLWPVLRDRGGAGAPAGRPSLAVLPLTDASPGNDQSTWCRGISESLIDSLARMRSVDVRGRQSSFQFTADDDVGEVGRRLNVKYLLTGTLQRSDSRLRISLRLIDTGTDRHLWSETFDGDAQEIFDIQDRITAKVTGRLNASFAGTDPLRVPPRRTDNPEAYDAYLRARRALSGRTVDDLVRAIPMLHEAIAKDRNFALPYAALAETYAYLYVSFGAIPRQEAHDQAKAALGQALALDSENVPAIVVRAVLKADFENDCLGAGRDFLQALRLSPEDPTALVHHNFFLIQKGHLAEALEGLNLLIHIDPAVPQNYFYRGRLYYFLKRYDEGLADYEKALQMDPGHRNTIEWSVLTYLARGWVEKAAEAASRIEAWDPPYASTCRAWISAFTGDRHARTAPVTPVKTDTWALSIYHAARGDRTEALANLAILAERNRGILAFAYLTHAFDKYRSDPAFLSLLTSSCFESGKGAARSR
jgi:TolB-like protein/tetratricopeptide (TPR) repeat protein